MKRLQEEFKCECRLIDLKQEYPGLVGEERWAIVSELTEDELWKKYPEEMRRYVPFVRLSMGQAEAIREFNRNEEKFRKRARMKGDVYGYEDGLSECFHRELVIEDYWKIQEQEELQKAEGLCLKKALLNLTPKQRQRILEYYIAGKTLVNIGQEEQVSYQVVEKSIKAALRKMKKYF